MGLSQRRPTGHPSHLLTVLAGTAATLEPQNRQTLEPFGMSCYSFAPLQIWKRRQEKATNMQMGQTRSTISYLPLITWCLSLSMGTLTGLSQFYKVPAGNPVSWAEPLPTRGEAAITEQIGNSSVLKREGIYLVLNQTRPTEACGTEP